MRWWPYIDGYYLARGIDLMDLLLKYGSERSFNIIDNIIIEEALKDAETQGSLTKSRAILNKEYGRIGTNGSNDETFGEGSQLNYVEQTEDGFVGFEAPLG